jgi:hypothetical protein
VFDSPFHPAVSRVRVRAKLDYKGTVVRPVVSHSHKGSGEWPGKS